MSAVPSRNRESVERVHAISALAPFMDARRRPWAPPAMTQISDGFTSITVNPDEVAFAGRSAFEPECPSKTTQRREDPTGARVTVEFRTRTPLNPDRQVCVRYDIAGNGDEREFCGFAQLTHTARTGVSSFSYHYRLSYWIPAVSLMRFVASA